MLIFIFLLLGTSIAVDFQPRHVHLALGPELGSLTVTWSTTNKTSESRALLGQKRFEKEFNGNAKIFIDGGPEGRAQYIHTVTMTGLAPDTYYLYRVGSSQGWSDLFFHRTHPDGVDWSPTIALYGDLGNENAVSLPFLQRDIADGAYDLVIHVGDMAYDMAEENGGRGDVFMEQIEPIASVVPYMVCPGNHEQHYNFSHYKARFTMPGDEEERMFYSFNVGPVHFVSISTEYYYFVEYGTEQMVNQYHWLEQDLAQANTLAARSQQPWVVVFGHRPMYCSNNDDDDCTLYETRTRVGMPPLEWWGLEELLYTHEVDLAVWAHEHSYERLLPIYNRTISPGPDPRYPYRDPEAPVHIVTGSAGCREKHDGFIPDPPAWSAFRSSEYGYTRMKVENASHMLIQQLSVEPSLHLIDQFWLEKTVHKYRHPAHNKSNKKNQTKGKKGAATNKKDVSQVKKSKDSAKA